MTTITEHDISAWLAHLANEERAAATVEKYARDIRVFAAWLSGAAVTKENAVAYKQTMAETHKATSVNAAIAALNGFFAFLDWSIKLKPLKIQRQTFRPKEKELTKDEYRRLLAAAKSKGNERLNLVLQAICSTGIRVSELRFITVEAARSGEAEITNKGKTRAVFIPSKLQTALLRYAKERGIESGCIFITKSGRPLDRSNVWAEMKKLCAAANVPEGKVFPHNLRRLFARLFYGIEKDVIRLADILGHSSVDTTRIYLMESGERHRRCVEALGLVT
jgi:site-specific recombinase XerD